MANEDRPGSFPRNALAMMSEPLARLALCKTEQDVGATAVDALRQVFGTSVCGAFYIDPASRITERTVFGVRASAVEDYETNWRSLDPVLPIVLGQARPIHHLQLVGPPWESRLIYKEYCVPLGIHHYMSAPIFGARGRLAGVLNFCRRREDKPFDSESVMLASTLAGFVSATLSRVNTEDRQPTDDEAREVKLASRELQVARLAASGENNLEIALRLGLARETIKQALGRVYQKLGVRGRADMAAKLSKLGLLA
jgi:DNA-binding CsgD family transcriptional regulator